MIKWLIRVLWGCSGCFWEVRHEGNIITTRNEKSTAIGKYYHLQCKTCGRMKHESFEQ